MRIIPIILVSAVLGAALGATAAIVQFRMDPSIAVLPASDPSAKPSLAGRPTPRVEVAEPEFNFDTMRRGAKNSHEFVVKNVGTAPLTLQVGDTTCKCTLGVASDAPILPGESVNVHLEWIANTDPGPFRQTATLITNDPLEPRVSLVVQGKVSAAEAVEPPEFLFDKISAGQGKSAQVFVMAMLEDQLTISEVELANPDTRAFFDVQVEPADRDELPNPEAKAGVRIVLVLKPGLPVGVFNQLVKLRTSLQDAPTLNIPALGRVVGDISIHGGNWDEGRGVLRLGSVKSSEGKRARLNLVVRGADAAAVMFNVQSCDPSEIKVTIGEPKRLSQTLVHVPLEIEVPSGTPPMVRLGTDQGKDGRIILGTTHPTVRELVLGVRFSVER